MHSYRTLLPTPISVYVCVHSSTLCGMGSPCSKSVYATNWRVPCSLKSLCLCSVLDYALATLFFCFSWDWPATQKDSGFPRTWGRHVWMKTVHISLHSMVPSTLTFWCGVCSLLNVVCILYIARQIYITRQSEWPISKWIGSLPLLHLLLFLFLFSQAPKHQLIRNLHAGHFLLSPSLHVHSLSQQLRWSGFVELMGIKLADSFVGHVASLFPDMTPLLGLPWG